VASRTQVAKWAAVASLALALGPWAEANTTYTYTGNPFNQFVNPTTGPNPYNTSDFIQVTFTTVSPLPPSQPFPYFPSDVVSIQMTDGGNGPSVDPMGTVGCSASSTVCTGIAVATDANGAITQWVIFSATCPNSGCITTPTSGFQSVFGTENVAAVGVASGGVGLDFAARCGTTSTGCDPTTTTGALLVAAGFNLTSPGTWSKATQPTVQVTPSPATLGQPVTVSVTIPGTPTPTGPVQLQVNGNDYGNAVLLVNGAATFHIPDSTNNIPDPSLILPVLAGTGTGPCPTSNSVVVVYTGDANYPRGTQTVCLTVAPTFAISPNPAVYGQPVTLSSMVYNPQAPSNITSVVFTWDDSPTSPQQPVNTSNGQAQFQLPVLNAGTHCCVGVYSLQTSDGQSHGVPGSNFVNLVINKANTATGLTLAQNGSNTTFTATVAVVAPGAGKPTGTVTFMSGSTVLATAPLTNGAAMLSLSNFSGTVTAAYGGDNNFNGSASSGVTVNPPPTPPPPPPPPSTTTHVSLSSSLNPSQFGQAVTFTASVTPSSGTGTPSGNVQFLDGTTSLGSAALSGGSASFTTTSLAVGSHAVVAQYGGDGSFQASSASMGQVVNRIASTLTLSVSPAQVSTGQSVTLTAKVGPAPASGVPAATGQVTFSAGGNALGSAAISGGTASITTTSLAAGTVQLSASYGGDQNYAASKASATVTVLAGALKITTTSLPNGNANQPYTASVAAIGGAQPYKFTIGGLPPGLTSDTTGAISGTPTNGGNFNVTVQVTDNAGGTDSVTLTLNISGLAISVMLLDGKQGANYSGSVSVSGGAAPYKLVITGLPPGLTATVSGASATISGQPTTAGTFTVTVQATDSKNASASGPFRINITTAGLTLGSGSAAGGMVGQPYSQCVTVNGGTPPFTFSATLPAAGLSIDPATGCISGTPTVGGAVTVTIGVTDSTGAKNSVTFTVNFTLPALSPVNFTGLGTAADPRTQPGFGVAITGPYPVDITGTLTLAFKPATGADTGEVTFATGSRTLTFTIPASSTTAVFTIPTAALQTGTVAGSITITASFSAGGTDITPSPAPTRQIQVNAGSPVIVSATAARTSTGFTVSITGYTSTREVTQAGFVFNPATGANLQTTSLTLQVGSLFSLWLQGTQVIGSQFLFTQPFTVSGNLQAVTSISVTLTNSQGSSQPVTATIQ
jgi:large repetitive protein